MRLVSIIILIIIIFCIVGYKILINFFIQDEIRKVLNSPDGKYKAIAYVRDGGATTSYSPQVTLKRKWDIFTNDFSGNVFRGYRSASIDIYWKDNKTLVIIHSCKGEDIFKQEKSKYGINIVYEFAYM